MTSAVDGFDPEAIFEIPAHGQDRAPLSIAIAKAGGGTLGRAYEGTWHIAVRHGATELYRGGDLTTAQPRTHRQAARELAALIPAAQGVSDLADRLAAFACGDLTPTLRLAQETS